jgi:hypothetical protein
MRFPKELQGIGWLAAGGALEELTNHRPLQFFDQLEFIRARDCYYPLKKKRERHAIRVSGCYPGVRPSLSRPLKEDAQFLSRALV